MDKEFNVAKIVATPTLSSWSQAYNAGKLFAVLSLKKEVPEEGITDENFLSSLGKNTIETLENEFFTLETKTLDSIKTAFEKTCEGIESNVSVSFVVSVLVKNALYVFIKGKGKASLKRGESFGEILFGIDDDLKNASGFLQKDDIVILETDEFSQIISDEKLSQTLDHQPPSEVAESLAPIIHEKEEGGASAVLFEFKGSLDSSLNEPLEQPLEETPIEAPKEEKPMEDLGYPETPLQKEDIKLKYINLFKNYLSFALKKLPKIKNLELQKLNHTKRLTLTVVILLLLIFLGSVLFAVKKQESDKNKAVFTQIYTEASKKYDEGQGLLELNQNLARDSFLKAQQALISGQNKLSKGSEEAKKVTDLLSKINQALENSSGVISVNATEVSGDESNLLTAEKSTSGSLYSSQNDDTVYVLTKSAVLSVKNGKSSSYIKNDNNWTDEGGLGAYLSYVYILDKSAKQIYKFTSATSKTNYFTTSPDLSSAVSMTIDGSIYILSKDGQITKFTKGASDTFSIIGLDKGFLSPSRIFTNSDSDNLYVLDNGNSRIVVLDKTGSYKAQYKTDVLKTAKDFEVKEKDKKILILSGGKVFKIEL